MAKLITTGLNRIKFNIWLVNRYGDVLIRNKSYFKEKLEVRSVTLEANSMKDLLKEIERDWGILCNEEDLKEIYYFCNGSEEVHVLTLELALDKTNEAFVVYKSSGMFVNYRDLEDVFKMSDKDEDFREEFYSLLSELDKKYCTVS